MSRSPCFIDHYLRWICVLKIEVKYHIMKVGVLNFWKICFQKHSNFQICQLNDSYKPQLPSMLNLQLTLTMYIGFLSKFRPIYSSTHLYSHRDQKEVFTLVSCALKILFTVTKPEGSAQTITNFLFQCKASIVPTLNCEPVRL